MNRNGVDMERINEFFGCPSWPASVFKSDIEAVIPDPLNFSEITIILGNAKTGVVEGRSSRINLAASVENAEKLLPMPVGAVGIVWFG
jgi:hypothetical protein